MPALSVRWSEHEAKKEYARPFGVSFLDDAGANITSIAVNGRELVYYTDFQEATLRLVGELFMHPDVEMADDPQRAWLGVVATLIPAFHDCRLRPVSSFDHTEGRRFFIDIVIDGNVRATVPAAAVIDYQELQCGVAHQSGHLFRVPEIEHIDSDVARKRAWRSWLTSHFDGPDDDDSVGHWPWAPPL